jgi:hypothetical protein
MPRTKVQKLFFIFLTVLISVHAFAIYNVALGMGSMSNRVFLLASREVPVELFLAFVLEVLFVARLAEKLAFFTQIFLIGPLVRFLFGVIFRQPGQAAPAVSAGA